MNARFALPRNRSPGVRRICCFIVDRRRRRRSKAWDMEDGFDCSFTIDTRAVFREVAFLEDGFCERGGCGRDYVVAVIHRDIVESDKHAPASRVEICHSAARG
jgi:hypothetical protein